MKRSMSLLIVLTIYVLLHILRISNPSRFSSLNDFSWRKARKHMADSTVLRESPVLETYSSAAINETMTDLKDDGKSYNITAAKDLSFHTNFLYTSMAASTASASMQLDTTFQVC
jgi:hypothetical protein